MSRIVPLLCSLIWLVTCGVSNAQSSFSSVTLQSAIAPQPLAAALQSWAKQSGMQVMYATDLVAKFNSPGAPAGLAARDALDRLLDGTGLQYRVLNERTVSVVEKRDAARPPSADAVLPSAAAGDKDPHGGANDSAGARFRLAQATQGVATETTSVEKNNEQTPQKMSVTLEEVVVTAQKRAERLQDVPVPMSVMSTKELEQNNQTSLTDYYNEIPGLSLGATAAGNYSLLVIRGISTGSAHDPTVGVTIDDQPFGGYSNIGPGNTIPEIDPNDLERVEVLRGPQGTLYGVGSMGGLLRFITKDPTPEAFSGSVTATGLGIRNASDPGYALRASANIPLGNELAVRVSGFTREDPGYIDDPVRGVSGINESIANGGMAAMKWVPSDLLSLKLRANFQSDRSGGSSLVGSDLTPGLGDLQQNYPPGVGAYSESMQAYSAVLKAKLGAGIELTSVTGYNVVSLHSSYDFTTGFGAAAAAAPYHSPYAPDFQTSTVHSGSQELRLSGSIGESFDWLLGGFYTYQRNNVLGYFLAEGASGGITGNLYDYFPKVYYREYAGFTTLTYHVTDRFDVQIGGRESHIQTNESEGAGGDLNAGLPTYTGYTPQSNSIFSYLVTPRLKLTPDLMLYARASTGYRPGGSNGQPLPGGTPYPVLYNSDKTRNYEFGLKADMLDHRLSIDASVYYVDWKDIQLVIHTPADPAGHTGNGSRAKSEGVEFSMDMHPLRGLTLSLWVDYDDAAFADQAPPGTYGPPGARLPYSSRWSGAASLLQEFPIGQATMFFGAQLNLVGNRFGEFQGCTQVSGPCMPLFPRDYYPGYTQTNLRTGAKYGPWTLNLFANNVTDKRGLLGGGALDVYPNNSYTIIKPRTIGLSLSRNF